MESSPIQDVFSGKLKERSKCRICGEHDFQYANFTVLNFNNYTKTQKSDIKENRQAYENLLSSEVKPKSSFFFKSFEKFYVSIVDHFYDFLNKGNNEEMNDTFYCENCKMTINCAKRYNFLQLPEVLAVGFDYDPLKDSSEELPMKIEQTINLSFFVSEDNVDEQDVHFTKYLSTINEDIGTNTNKADTYSTDIYNLKGLIQLKPDPSSKKFVYVHYVNLKGKWLMIENGKQKALNKPPYIISTPDSPVIFCYYQKERKVSAFDQDIKDRLSVKADPKTPHLSVPDDFVYKLLHLNTPGKPSLDFFFCPHKQLKPLFQDIYGFKKQPVSFDKHISFPYTGSKKFNKELEEYKHVQKRKTIGYDTPDVNKFYNKSIDRTDLKHSNTVEFTNVENFNNETLDCSFARLSFLANSVNLPQSVAQRLIEEFNYTNKDLGTLEKPFYAKKCQTCTIGNKKIIINRILQKAMVMNLLTRKEPQNYLIDICWFKNFKLFLLADISQDNLAKHLFNYEYVTEKFNINMHFYYTQFKHNYSNTKEMLKNEFVSINNSLFWLLKQVYNCEDIIVLDQSQLRFLEHKEFINNSCHSLTQDEALIFSLLQRFIQEKEQMVQAEEFNLKNYKMKDIDNMSSEEVHSLMLDIYDELLILNKKMNVFIKTKIKTDYKIFDNSSEAANELSYWKNLKKLYKMLGTHNLDAIDFNPCRTIKEIIQTRLSCQADKENRNELASIDRLIKKNTIKESNVIKQMDSKDVNDFLDSIENKKKRIIKTRNYLDNIELSHQKKKAEPEEKSPQSDGLDSHFDSVNKTSLFSKDSSISGVLSGPIQKEAKDSKFKNNSGELISQSQLTDSMKNNPTEDPRDTLTIDEYIDIEPKFNAIDDFEMNEDDNSLDEYKNLIRQDTGPRLTLPKDCDLVKENIQKVLKNSCDIMIKRSSYTIESNNSARSEGFKLTIKRKNSSFSRKKLITFEQNKEMIDNRKTTADSQGKPYLAKKEPSMIQEHLNESGEEEFTY